MFGTLVAGVGLVGFIVAFASLLRHRGPFEEAERAEAPPDIGERG